MDGLTSAIASGIGSWASKVGAARVTADATLTNLELGLNGDEQALRRALESAQRTIDILNGKEAAHA